MKTLFLRLMVLLFVSASFTTHTEISDRDWELTKVKGDIKVYTRKNDSGLKEIRMTTSIKAPLENFKTVLGDAKRYKEWVYKCSEARKTQHISEDEFIYYVEIDFPFPASDRDLIIQTKQWVDSKGKYHSHSVSANSSLVVDDSNVRIKDYESSWTAIPENDGSLFLEYQSSSDPGGNIPQWIVNMGIAIGPLKSMEGVIELTLKE